MSVLAPVATGSALGRLNPVAKIAATIPITLALVLTLDWVSATVALLLEIALLTAGGLGRVVFSARTLPVWLAARSPASAWCSTGRRPARPTSSSG